MIEELLEKRKPDLFSHIDTISFFTLNKVKSGVDMADLLSRIFDEDVFIKNRGYTFLEVGNTEFNDAIHIRLEVGGTWQERCEFLRKVRHYIGFLFPDIPLRTSSYGEFAIAEDREYPVIIVSEKFDTLTIEFDGAHHMLPLFMEGGIESSISIEKHEYIDEAVQEAKNDLTRELSPAIESACASIEEELVLLRAEQEEIRQNILSLERNKARIERSIDDILCRDISLDIQKMGENYAERRRQEQNQTISIIRSSEFL